MSVDVTSEYGIFIVILGYLLGSIPFGLLLTRLAGFGDLRSMGSGNIGATNVLRTGSKPLAFLTLLADILKGAIPALIGLQFGPVEGAMGGFAAFLGHLFPVWLNFRGGKGVATYIGVLLALIPLAAAGFALVWLAVALVSRYSSLSALIAAALIPLAVAPTGNKPLVALFLFMSILLFWKHRENIARLASGEESKIGRTS